MNLQSQCRGDKTGHRWKMLVHMDGCHWYTSTYICVDCSAAYTVTLERDLAEDPYSAMWLDYGADDLGAEQCDRCRELLDGAAPRETFDFQPV